MTFFDTETKVIYPDPQDSGVQLSLAAWMFEAADVYLREIANNVRDPGLFGTDWAAKKVWMLIKNWMFDQGLYPIERLQKHLNDFQAKLTARRPWEEAVADLAASFNFTADGTWWFVRYLVHYMEEVKNETLYHQMQSYRGTGHIRERWDYVLLIHREELPDGSIRYPRMICVSRPTDKENIDFD